MNDVLRVLIEVGLSSAVMILAVLLLRQILGNFVSRRAACVLWDIVLVRLFVPISLSSPWSVWGLLANTHAPAGPATSAAIRTVTATSTPTVPATSAVAVASHNDFTALLSPQTIAVLVWLSVALILAICFALSHMRALRTYKAALPCGDSFVTDWLARHALRRPIQVRMSDYIEAPLTYGIFRPVILLPSNMDLADHALLACVLEHEYQHIRRFDVLSKLFLSIALCVYWISPFVWIMYLMANKDMELACDEAALRAGVERKTYALALLSMEERRIARFSIASPFGANALEERIRHIMKHKRITIIAVVVAVAVLCVVTTVFATAPSAPENEEITQNPTSTASADGSNDMLAVTELLAREENGSIQYSSDGGATWMSEAQYSEKYGVPEIEWWTPEEFEQWLEEEKIALNDIIGARGYTSTDGWFTWDQARVDETIAMYESMLEDMKT